ncbi:hypothetical protein [Nocardia brasiliensis]|uniref:hypothetical protein n=1 Tax=Nocardia brasiliensis TaxID=37326 RepID=UPI00366E3F8C
MKLSMFGSAVVAAGGTVLIGTAVAHAGPPAEPEPTASIGSVELAESGLAVTVNYLCHSDEVDGLVLSVEQTSDGKKVIGGGEAKAECDGEDKTKKFTITPSEGDKFQAGEVEINLEMIGNSPAAITEKRTVE